MIAMFNLSPLEASLSQVSAHFGSKVTNSPGSSFISLKHSELLSGFIYRLVSNYNCL